MIPAVLLLGIMTGAAELLNEREIIFPVAAALAVGYLCAPTRAWTVSSRRMALLIPAGVMLGLVLSLYVPGDLYGKMLLAFAAAQILYLYSGTSLATLVAAVVLPVFIGAGSVSCVISAAGTTAAVVLIHEYFVRRQRLPVEPFTPVKRPDRRKYLRFAVRFVVFAGFLFAALKIGWRFMAAPPLLVAFTELSESWSPSSKRKPLRVILLISGCALIGAVCRFGIVMTLGLPLTLAAVCAAAGMLFVMERTGLFMPPAGAMTMLAMLIPESAVVLYPLQAFLGIAVYMPVAMVISGKLGKEGSAAGS